MMEDPVRRDPALLRGSFLGEVVSVADPDGRGAPRLEAAQHGALEQGRHLGIHVGDAGDRGAYGVCGVSALGSRGS